MYSYDNISLLFFLEREMFHIEDVGKIKTHILCSVIPPPPNIVPFMG